MSADILTRTKSKHVPFPDHIPNQRLERAGGEEEAYCIQCCTPAAARD
jgi:hypothetical protein